MPASALSSTPAPSAPRETDDGTGVEHLDVLIVGAGISGIGAACHLRRLCPHKSFAILEAREAIGGTWDLFRYPGIRSDSDMFTLAYSFKPWTSAQSIVEGPEILDYVRETAHEHGIVEQVRFDHRVLAAHWSSEDARWTVTARRQDTGEDIRLTCSFLLGCTGYYRYEEGHAPRFEGQERFANRIVHPQHWPADLDCSGKRVVVIGSGATAVTLVPALARSGAHVTMLQRSPSYIVSLPARDRIAAALLRRLPTKTAYKLIRIKNVLMMMLSFELSRCAPKLMRATIRRALARQLPPGYEIDEHFNPAYEPWDQRLCLVPDGDLFQTLCEGRAAIVTDTIEALTQNGIQLASGEHLEADVIVTATGLQLLSLGGIELSVDGRSVDPGATVAYKGMMLGGVPNMALVIGYSNASWTLKADLVASYVCRLLSHMDANGLAICTPRQPDPSLPTEPIIGLRSGYVLRSIDLMPRQGARPPWRLHQNYFKDLRMLGRGPIDDEMDFARVPPEEPRRAFAVSG